MPCNCNETNQNPFNQITPCIEPNCACDVFLDSKCVTNISVDTPCVDIPKGLPMNEWIPLAFTRLCTKIADVASNFVLKNVGAGVGKLYKGISILGEKEIKSIKAGNLVTVTNLTDDVEVAVDNIVLTTFVNGLEKTSSISNLGTTGAKIYDETPVVTGNNTEYKVRRINSNDFLITSTADTININASITFQGLGYYVNVNYTGTEELGTMSKPFITLQKCIDKILNRGGQNDGINPVKNKWDNLPTTKVYIQSNQDHTENLAINNVEYVLQNNSTVNHTGTEEYNLDMRLLVNNAPKTSLTLNYSLLCSITGNGTLLNSNVNRKGCIFANGYNNGTDNFQPESNVLLGDENSNIILKVNRNTSLNYIPLINGANENQALGTPIIREGTAMLGYQTTSVPEFGLISIEGQNKPFNNSLRLAGNIEFRCFEQHLIYSKNSGFYGVGGSLYIQRSYQFVNYSQIEEIARNPLTPLITNKYYKPSKHVSEIYLDNSGCSYSGLVYSQQNTISNQGGSESFIILKGKSIATLTNADIINLYYNHFIKFVHLSSYLDYEGSQVSLTNYNFKSICFEELYNIINEDVVGIETPNTQFLSNTSFINSYFNNKFFGIIRNFTNKIINTNLLLNSVDATFLATGLFAPSLITCLDNADAISKNLPIGSEYRTSTGEKRIVI